MGRDLTDFLKNGAARTPEPPSSAAALPDACENGHTAPPPKSDPEDEQAYDLIAKWSNSVFKFLEICAYIPRFSTMMHLRFMQGGIDIIGMDCSHVARIEIHLDRKDFADYRFNQETREFYINFQDLAKKCKRFSKTEDVITMGLDADPVLRFQCHGIHFCQKNLESDMEVPPTPEIIFKDTCTANHTDLIEVLEFASDHANFARWKTANGLRIEGECEDGTTFHKTLKIREAYFGDAADNLYHIEYLLDILRITKTKTLDRLGVQLKFGHQMPLFVTMQFAMHSFFRAYLAPRVEEEIKEEKDGKGRDEERAVEGYSDEGFGNLVEEESADLEEDRIETTLPELQEEREVANSNFF